MIVVNILMAVLDDGGPQKDRYWSSTASPVRCRSPDMIELLVAHHELMDVHLCWWDKSTRNHGFSRGLNDSIGKLEISLVPPCVFPWFLGETSSWGNIQKALQLAQAAKILKIAPWKLFLVMGIAQKYCLSWFPYRGWSKLRAVDCRWWSKCLPSQYCQPITGRFPSA